MLTEILFTSSVACHSFVSMTSAYHFAAACWFLLRLCSDWKVYAIDGEILKQYKDGFFVLAVLLLCAGVKATDLSFLPLLVVMICGYYTHAVVVVLLTTMWCMYVQWTSATFLLSCYLLAHTAGCYPKITFSACAAIHFLLAAMHPLEADWLEIGVGILHTESLVQAFHGLDLRFLSHIGALCCATDRVEQSVWCYLPACFSLTYFWNARWYVYRYMPIGYTGIWFFVVTIVAMGVKQHLKNVV